MITIFVNYDTNKDLRKLIFALPGYDFDCYRWERMYYQRDHALYRRRRWMKIKHNRLIRTSNTNGIILYDDYYHQKAKHVARQEQERNKKFNKDPSYQRCRIYDEKREQERAELRAELLEYFQFPIRVKYVGRKAEITFQNDVELMNFVLLSGWTGL